MTRLQKLVLLLLLSSSVLAHASEWREDARIDALFAKEGVRGTFVVHDVAADVYTVHDRKRAAIRFIPASTFKIPNSLIGLDTGTVENVDAILPYGGGKTARPEWAHDMSLRDAIKISNVPLYQGMARRIGLDLMRKNVRRLDYGNGQIGDKVDMFWLKGPLKISALEQTAFLQKLAQDNLPFARSAMAAVRDITRQEGSADLHAKTGYGLGKKNEAGIGWWVGWVVKEGKLYTFALNIDIPNGDNYLVDRRVPLGKAALQVLDLL